MKFNGTNWVNVGNAGFSTGEANFTNLAFNPSDNLPYVSYENVDNSGKAFLNKFDGSNWVIVGNVGISKGVAFYESLAFNSSGQPYVAYKDEGNSAKATVMKFDGTNWDSVGTEGFSEGVVSYVSLALNPNNNYPYVAYMDIGNSWKATVMYYNAPAGINILQSSKISVCPNPATDKITIEIAAGLASSQLSIINLNGEEVLTRQITQPKTQIDISNLPSGVYIVRLTNDKTVEVRKIIKE